MIDRLTAAYRPLATKRTKDAVKTLNAGGARAKIDVENSSNSEDRIKVDAWIAKWGGEDNFFFEDGPWGDCIYGDAASVKEAIAGELTAHLD